MQQTASRARALLYVEDDPLNVTLVERLLRQRPNLTLFVATDGGSAVEVALEQRPDLILLDRRLPDITGEEVLRKLKAVPETAAIPVVIQSGDSGRATVQGFIELGATDFLAKPFDRDQFFAVVDRFCE